MNTNLINRIDLTTTQKGFRLIMDSPSMLLVGFLSFVLFVSTCNQCNAYQSSIPVSLTKITNIAPFSSKVIPSHHVPSAISQNPITKSTTVNPIYSKPASLSSSSLFSESTSSSDDAGSLKSSDKNKTKNMFARLMNKIKPKTNENMSTKEMLAKMGLSALLTYGWISNTFICGTVSAAWFVFNKRVRKLENGNGNPIS